MVGPHKTDSEFFDDVKYLTRFFFFSSRRRHTRSYGDWSSDVCSSDLTRSHGGRRGAPPPSWRSGPALAPTSPTIGNSNLTEIGRASCRERVEISEVVGSVKTKFEHTYKHITVISIACPDSPAHVKQNT